MWNVDRAPTRAARGPASFHRFSTSNRTPHSPQKSMKSPFGPKVPRRVAVRAAIAGLACRFLLAQLLGFTRRGIIGVRIRVGDGEACIKQINASEIERPAYAYEVVNTATSRLPRLVYPYLREPSRCLSSASPCWPPCLSRRGAEARACQII